MQTVTVGGVQLQALVDQDQGLRTWHHFGPFTPAPTITYLTPPEEARRVPGRDGLTARIAFYTLCVRHAIAGGPTHTTEQGVPFVLLMPMCLCCGMATGNWCFGCESMHQVFSTPRCTRCETHRITCPVCGLAMDEADQPPPWAQHPVQPPQPDSDDSDSGTDDEPMPVAHLQPGQHVG